MHRPVETSPFTGLGAVTPDARPAAPSQGAPTQGPAFQALLERLQQQASQLEHEARTIQDDPQDLKGAVGHARASLQDALSLGDQLLEAYRGQQHRAVGGEG